MAPIKKNSRMTSQARRESIIESVTGAFADKGFYGTTTRELAKAAGVSEALLFKHFPSKEAIYNAILISKVEKPTLEEFNQIMAAKPSTATLITLVHLLVSHNVMSAGTKYGVVDRLMMRSYFEDGEFARLALKPFFEMWIGKFVSCLKAAAKSGDLRVIPVRRDLSSLFALQLAKSLMHQLETIVQHIDHKVTKEMLIEQAVWFVLLGAGIKEDAIERYYNPKEFELGKK
jgi:AcrR family transcriptional regulator